MTIRAVLLDAVGTTIRPARAVAETYYRTGRQYGSQLAREQVARRFQKAFRRHADGAPTSGQRERARWRAIVSETFADVADVSSLFDALWDYYAQAASWRLYDDVAPALRQLDDGTRALGLASNFDDRLVNICRHLPPLDRLEHVFVSSAVGYGKPHAEFFVRIQNALRLNPEQILLVGDDADHDVAGARAAGWHVRQIDRRGAVRGPHVIRSLELLARDLTAG